MTQKEKYNSQTIQAVPDGGFSDVVYATGERPSAIGAIGGILYDLGFGTEYFVMRVWRVVRTAGIFISQILSLVGLSFLGWAGGMLKSVGRDLAYPFVLFRRRVRQLSRVRRRSGQNQAGTLPVQGTVTKAGVKAVTSLAVQLGAIVLPMVSVAALFFIIYNVVNMQYALAVEYNGKILGYVVDQSVVESAKGLLRDRIKLADNQEITDWQMNPEYTIAKAPFFTPANQLANEILLAGSSEAGDIVPATGFYIGDHLEAVTTEGEKLKAYLENKLETQRAQAQEGAVVEFVEPVVCDPDSEDVFFASSVEDYDQLIQKLESTRNEKRMAQGDGQATLAEIALNNNITFEELTFRNPQLENPSPEDVPAAGEELLIQRAEPYLQVKSTLRVKSTETLPFQTTEIENADRPKGAKMKVQKGQDGEQEVWDDYVYIDGELTSRVRIDDMTVVLQAPVDEIYEIGTKEVRGKVPVVVNGNGMGAGYIFPVPDTTYSTRGYSPGGHRGLDINAAGGAPIYAAQGGTVVNAGWHYSFGNYVEIAHPGGVKTLYAHCSALYVSAGQHVDQGTLIGAVGSTGNSSGNHLHLEVTVNGALTDPVPYVGYPY